MVGRTAAWVGWSGDPGPAPEPFWENDLYLQPVGLTSAEILEYYEGFSNETLWPIYHDVIVPASFHRNWWNTYRTVNHRFAQAIAQVAAPGATVWVHDRRRIWWLCSTAGTTAPRNSPTCWRHSFHRVPGGGTGAGSRRRGFGRRMNAG